MNLRKNIRLILSGYAEKGRSLGVFLFFLLTSAGIGALIVFPLWKFAVSEPKTYSLVILGLAALGLLFYIIRRIGSSDRREMRKNPRGRWKMGLRIVFTVLSLYFMVTAFTSGAWVVGALLFIILFFLLGWIWFGSRDGKKYQIS